MASDYRVYINTLVFALVSCAILLGLLLALMFVSGMANYAAFCITLAAGLLLVVVAAVVRIMLHQRRVRALARNVRDNVVVVQTCPDYYTATNNMDGTVTCANAYVTGDGLANITFPSGPALLDLTQYDRMTMQEVCAAVDPTDPAAANYNIPWTNLRSICAGHNIS